MLSIVCAIGSCLQAAAPLIKATMSSWNWHRSCTYLLHLKICNCGVQGQLQKFRHLHHFLQGKSEKYNSSTKGKSYYFCKSDILPKENLSETFWKVFNSIKEHWISTFKWWKKFQFQFLKKIITHIKEKKLAPNALQFTYH